MHARKNYKRGEKLNVVYTATIELLSEGQVVTMRRVAKRIGYQPSTALMSVLWELCDMNLLRAIPSQHKGACPVRWTFDTVGKIVQTRFA